MHELLLLLLLLFFFYKLFIVRRMRCTYSILIVIKKQKPKRKKNISTSQILVEFLAFSRLCRTFHVFVRGYNHICIKESWFMITRGRGLFLKKSFHVTHCKNLSFLLLLLSHTNEHAKEARGQLLYREHSDSQETKNSSLKTQCW